MSDSLLKALLSFEICVQKMPAGANSLLFFFFFSFFCIRVIAPMLFVLLLVIVVLLLFLFMLLLFVVFEVDIIPIARFNKIRTSNFIARME